MRFSDCSSDVCSSDLGRPAAGSGNFARLLLRLADLATVRGSAADFDSARLHCSRNDTPEFDREQSMFEARRSDLDEVGKLDASIERSRERKSVGWGKGVAVRVGLGGRRISKKK